MDVSHSRTQWEEHQQHLEMMEVQEKENKNIQMTLLNLWHFDEKFINTNDLYIYIFRNMILICLYRNKFIKY